MKTPQHDSEQHPVSTAVRFLGLAAWTALLILPASARAEEPVPRQWSELSMEDVDIQPFYWWRSLCRAGHHPLESLGFKSCELSIKAVKGQRDPKRLPDGGSWSDMDDPILRISVSWLEREPPNCEAVIARYCNPPWEYLDRHVVRSRGRVASLGVSIVGFPFGIPDEARDRWQDEFPPNDFVRAARDILERIELYAIPCSCGGVRVGPPVDAPTAQPPDTDDGGSQPELPRGQIPEPGIEVPNVLGQDEDAFERPPAPGGGSRAFSRAGGFPPGVEVTSLRFYTSRSGNPPKEQRMYGTRFPDSLEFLRFELNLAYERRTERWPFALELRLSRDGRDFTTIHQDGYSLEPGWSTSDHTVGWGKVGGGAWPAGRYQVEALVGGKAVATGAFEVVGGDPAPVDDGKGLPPGVEVTSLRFFASSIGSTPRQERAYTHSFPTSVEYINVELRLTYPPRAERFPFEAEVAVYRNGEHFVDFSPESFSLEPTWTTSTHHLGWGQVGGGAWPAGHYRLELKVRGEIVAVGELEVVGVER